MTASVEGEELALASAAAVGLGGNIVVVKVDRGDGIRDRNATSSISNDGGVWRRAGGGVRDGGREGD